MTEFQRIADDIAAAMQDGRICPLQATASYRRVRGIARLVETNAIPRSAGLRLALEEERRSDVAPLGEIALPFVDFMLPIEDGRALERETPNA